MILIRQFLRWLKYRFLVSVDQCLMVFLAVYLPQPVGLANFSLPSVWLP